MIDAVVKVSMPLNDDRPSSFFACPLFSFLVCVRARVRACVCAVLQLRFDLCRPSPHFSTIVSWKEKYMCINIYIYIYLITASNSYRPPFLVQRPTVAVFRKVRHFACYHSSHLFSSTLVCSKQYVYSHSPSLTFFFFPFFFPLPPHRRRALCQGWQNSSKGIRIINFSQRLQMRWQTYRRELRTTRVQ